MNARVVPLHLAPTAERRRANALRDVSVALAALELTIRTTVPTLGNRAAYITLRAAYEKLDNQLASIECLADEFLELAQSDAAENSE